MAECKFIRKGNIISWTKEKFTINKAQVQDLNESDVFCKPQKKMIIFPERNPFKKAEYFCRVHGGNLALPSSTQDIESVLKILEKHRSTCLDSNNIFSKGKALWLGIQRKDRDWYRVNSNGDSIPVSFSNWDPDDCTARTCGADGVTSCAYMNKNGLWAFGLKSESCYTISLCPICEFTETPVFTLKGLCSETSPIDWNFYIRTNDLHQIDGYEGYKFEKFVKEKDQWVLRHPEVFANTSGDHPLGRRDWNYMDKTCEMKLAKKTSLTLSFCIPGKEFTCSGGMCVPLSHRCNQINDCEDQSDEQNCNLVYVPNSYDKLIAPGAYGSIEKAVRIQAKVSIKSIDFIDVKQMRIGLAFIIQLEWIDARLTFKNLDPEGNNFISLELANKIWLPSDHFIHLDAVLGETIKSPIRLLRARNLTHGTVDLTKASVEHYVYPGSKTRLHERVMFNVVYRCDFKTTKFPFDKHQCKFPIRMQV